jgi:putative transposase
MSKSMKVYRFRLKPTYEQSLKIDDWMNTCRWLYNKVLDYRIKDYEYAKLEFSIIYNQYPYLFERLTHDQEFLKIREFNKLTNKKKRKILDKEKIKRDLTIQEYDEIDKELKKTKLFKYKESGIPYEFYKHGYPVTNQGKGETSDYKYYTYLKSQARIDIRDKLNELPAIVAQDVLSRVDTAYKSFFRGGGYPKFKRKGEYNSLTWTQPVSFQVSDNFIELSRFGKIKVIYHRPIIGNAKQANIVKTNIGKYYINIIVEYEEDVVLSTGKIAAIDRNIKLNDQHREFMVIYDGEGSRFYEMPTYLRTLNDRLKNIQLRSSKYEKGSLEWRKLMQQQRHIWEKINNSKKNWIENVSCELSKKYDKIIVEKLDIKNMTNKEIDKKKASKKKSKSAENIELTRAKQRRRGWAEVSHSVFLNRLKQKIGENNIIEIDPAYTSMDCSQCGYRNYQLKLSDREWECPSCKTIHIRDSNAAINIYNRGMEILNK